MYSQPVLKAAVKQAFLDQLNAADQAAAADDLANKLANILFDIQDIYANAGFLPNTSTPSLPVGGGKIYVENGALKYIGSSGTITTLAPA